MQPTDTYLGHKIDHASADKVNAIQQAALPKNVTELHSFLGLLNYYGKFMPDLATLLHPLNQLLRENQLWIWTSACDQAFRQAKEKLSHAPVLVHYDPPLPIRLAGGASEYGIGAVLSYVMPKWVRTSLSFHILDLAQGREKLLPGRKRGVVPSFQKFHMYLCGRKFVLVTDHRPLTALGTKDRRTSSSRSKIAVLGAIAFTLCLHH